MGRRCNCSEAEQVELVELEKGVEEMGGCSTTRGLCLDFFYNTVPGSSGFHHDKFEEELY